MVLAVLTYDLAQIYGLILHLHVIWTAELVTLS